MLRISLFNCVGYALLISSILLTACVPVQGTGTPESSPAAESPTIGASSPTPDTQATIDASVRGTLAALPPATTAPTQSTAPTRVPTASLQPRTSTPTLSPTPANTVSPTQTIAPTETPTQVPTAAPTPTPTPTTAPEPTPTVSPPRSGGATPIPYSSSVFPHILAGTATINGSNAPTGTVVAAWIGGNLAGATSVKSGGKYSLALGQVLGQPPFGGKVITFTIGSLTAHQQIKWQSGGADPLSLTASQ